jgi:hypothetical protein
MAFIQRVFLSIFFHLFFYRLNKVNTQGVGYPNEVQANICYLLGPAACGRDLVMPP